MKSKSNNELLSSIKAHLAQKMPFLLSVKKRAKVLTETNIASLKNTAVFSTCSNNDITKCAATLLSIREQNKKANLFIISRNISHDSKNVLRANKINYIDIDLRGKFNRHWNNPVEDYYIFAGPELLFKKGFKNSLYIDPGFYCKSKLFKKVTTVTGIAGISENSYENTLSKDTDKIFDHYRIDKKLKNSPALYGAVILFNNKTMAKIKLLDTATELFKECLSLRTPLKEKGALLALIQLLKIKKEYLKQFNNILIEREFTSNDKGIFTKIDTRLNKKNKQSIYAKKWNKTFNTLNKSIKIQEDNSFSKEQIEHFENLGVIYDGNKRKENSKKKPLDIFVSEDDTIGIHNFGDELPKVLIPKLFGYKTNSHSNPQEAELFTVGSILFELNNIKDDGKTRFCWGSGFISNEPLKNERESIQKLKYFAVRGEYTRERIGAKTLPIGDPGLFANVLFPKAKTKHHIGIVYHYIDADNPIIEKLRQDNRFYLIDPLDTPEEVARNISSCEIILSSSLHGLIFADSYNIPNAHVNFSNKVYGGEYKFKDYESATGRKHLDIESSKLGDINYIHEVTSKYQPINNLEKIQKDLIDSFPY